MIRREGVFAQNQETYRIPARFSFSHRFFSTDLRSDAEADAVASLAETSPLGDNFMLQSEYQGLTVGQIAGFFGQEFADALARLETKPEWQGPIKSAYGWHAIKLDNIEPSYIPSYADVAQQVASDAASAASASAKNAYYEDLKESYEVVYSVDPVLVLMPRFVKACIHLAMLIASWALSPALAHEFRPGHLQLVERRGVRTLSCDLEKARTAQYQYRVGAGLSG